MHRQTGSDQSALPNMSRSYSEHNEKFFMILILTFSTFDRSMLNWVLTVFNSDILLHIGLYSTLKAYHKFVTGRLVFHNRNI